MNPIRQVIDGDTHTNSHRSPPPRPKRTPKESHLSSSNHQLLRLIQHCPRHCNPLSCGLLTDANGTPIITSVKPSVQVAYVILSSISGRHQTGRTRTGSPCGFQKLSYPSWFMKVIQRRPRAKKSPSFWISHCLQPRVDAGWSKKLKIEDK